MQQLGKLKIDDSFIGNRIEYLSKFDLVGEVKMKEIRWCGGIVKKLVMAHGSIWVIAVNVTKKMKQYLFFGKKLLRQTTPHHVQLILSMKRSGIIIVMDHGERN